MDLSKGKWPVDIPSLGTGFHPIGYPLVTRDDRVTKRQLVAHAMREKITKKKVDAV